MRTGLGFTERLVLSALQIERLVIRYHKSSAPPFGCSHTT
ncbi:hypothetical protein SAMN04487769_0561 [Burkholderia sp. b14]|nr:hypothetical protein SAMN04487769_0561 [Burkholderia sp. b14]